jgi:hypothetical protein
MSLMSDIQDLEREIAAAEDLVARREMAQRLSENHEFRKLFMDSYFTVEAARLVQMSTDPRVNKEIQASCLQEAQATGFMKRYLSDSIQMGYRAMLELPAKQAALEELRGYLGREAQYDAGEE